jgi:hypothetical protein
MELKRAERRKTKLKLAISSQSGGGKTYSSLLLAKGLCGDWSKVCVIDTENDSASLYAHLGPYNTLSLVPPFSPERYIEAMQACVDANMEVIIIDSISHEWSEDGGALEIQSQLGGRFQDWAKVTPRHRKFISYILQVPTHVIATMRRKTDYEIDKQDNRTIVRKVGLKEVQRDGVDYEFTTVFGLSHNHLATAEKDRTGLFTGKPEFKITEETGKTIAAWCDSGTASQNDSPPAATVTKGQPYTATDEQIQTLQEVLMKQNIPVDKWDVIGEKMKGRYKKDLPNVIKEVTSGI